MRKIVFNLVYSISFMAAMTIWSPIQAMLEFEAGAAPVHAAVVLKPLHLDNEVIETLRAFARKRNHYTYDKINNEHAPELIPLAEKLLEYVESLPENNAKKAKLKAQITSRIAQEEVGIIWLQLKYFEVAREKRHPSAEEIDLLRHAVLLKDNGCSCRDFLNVDIDIVGLMFMDEGRDDHYPFLVYVHRDMVADVEDKLTRCLPRIIYPFIGKTKFSIPFLVETYLRDIFPIAFSDTSVYGHGIDLSPLGFAFHDILHASNDAKHTALRNHILREMDRYVEKGGSAHIFLDIYLPYAVRSYERIMNALHYLLKEMEQISVQGETRSLAGFILMTHEYPPYNSPVISRPSQRDVSILEDQIMDAFSQADFLILMEGFTTYVQRALNSSKSWESPEDPLKTSPITGESTASDAEIMELSRKRLTHHKLSNATIAQDQQTILKDIERQIVTRGLRFIDVQTVWRDGYIETDIYITLAHKWKNMDDMLALLAYAGISIQKPDLSLISDSEEQYRVAREVLSRVQTELRELVVHFNRHAQAIIQRTGMAAEFTRSYREQEEEVKKRLEKSLPESCVVNEVDKASAAAAASIDNSLA